MVGRDGGFLYDETGIATFEHDEEGKVFTFEIEKGVKYHDGEELTVDDWILAHEVIAHPDYEGPRFDATLRNVEGIEEDRKSTRLNSSHVAISYAVFCLKKKKNR